MMRVTKRRDKKEKTSCFLLAMTHRFHKKVENNSEEKTRTTWLKNSDALKKLKN